MSTAVSQTEWNGVYYDGERGEHYTITIGDDAVQLREVFGARDPEVLEIDEFREYAEAGVFTKVSPDVVDDPISLVEEIHSRLHSLYRGRDVDVGAFDTADATFALKATLVVRASYDLESGVRAPPIY